MKFDMSDFRTSLNLRHLRHATEKLDQFFTDGGRKKYKPPKYVPVAQTHHHASAHLTWRRHLPYGVHLNATSHRKAPATWPPR